MGNKAVKEAIFLLIQKLVQRRGLTRMEADEILAVLNKKETENENA